MVNERKIIADVVNRLLLKEYVKKTTERAGFGGIDIRRTPMGTLVTLIAERPGMVIGHRGKTIKELTSIMETRFEFDNPQIEVEEVKNPNLNANIMAHKLAVALERGWHFRRAGHSTVRKIIGAGARGCQVILAGKLTGERHRTEKFKEGHIKYCGETALRTMDIGYAVGKKKLGVIGIKVMIMKPDAVLPDEITILNAEQAKGIVPEAEVEKLKIDTSLEADDVIEEPDDDVESIVESLIESAKTETDGEAGTETVTTADPVVGSEAKDEIVKGEETEAPEIQAEIAEPEKSLPADDPDKEIPESKSDEAVEDIPTESKEVVSTDDLPKEDVPPVKEEVEHIAEVENVEKPSEPAEISQEPAEQPEATPSATDDPKEVKMEAEKLPEVKDSEVTTEVKPPADEGKDDKKVAEEAAPKPVKVKKKTVKKSKTATKTTKKPRAKKPRTKKSEASKDTKTEPKDEKPVEKPASEKASSDEQPDSDAAVGKGKEA